MEMSMEIFRLEDRVLFEAAAAAEIAEAADNDPNADMNHNDEQARDERNEIKNAPPENPAAGSQQNAPAPQPDKVADIDAEIQALIEGDISVPTAGIDTLLDIINDAFNDYGANAVEDAIRGTFTEKELILPDADITVEPEQELVIINNSVQDMDAIINSLGQNQEYLILDAGKDAMAQINEYLDASGKEYSAIHLVSHGNSGYFILNGQVYDAENFDAEAWADIGSHLTEDGDIMLYGCNLAESEAGQNFVAMIADASGADVAASIDHTGIGGDWILEYQHGTIEALSITVDGYNFRLNDWRVTLSTDDFSTSGGQQDDSLTFDLRYAVTNSFSGDSISFKLDGTDTITLNGKLVINQSELTISGANQGTGAGDGLVTIQTNGGDFHLFEANNTSTDWNLTFRNINLIGNRTGTTTVEGGAIYISGRNVILNLDHVDISDSIAKHGGAVYAKAGDTLNLTATASTFTGNATTSWGYGGAIYANATVLNMTLADSHFENNFAYSYGGAVTGWMVTGATGTINVDNSTFTGNTVTNNDGGAMYFGGGAGSLLATITMVVNDSLFEHNSGSHLSGGSPGGGAIAFRSCGSVDLTITDSQFLNNDGYEGGALLIVARNHIKLTIDGSEFISNSTIKQDGGAMSVQIGGSSTEPVYGTEISIKNSLFEGNDAIRGGAISVNDLSKSIKMDIADTTFKGNTAWQNGGAINLRADKGSILLNINDGTIFDGNKAATSAVAQSAYTGYGGGAIAAWGMGGVTINVNGTYDEVTNAYSVQFINNTVESVSDDVLLYGGAIAIATPTAYLSPVSGTKLTGTVNITGAYFANNTVKATGSNAQGQGGAVYVNPYVNSYSYNISSESNVNISGKALFENNSATTAGGAIYATSVRYLYSGTASTLTAHTKLNISGDVQFISNQSGSGGAIYLDAVSAKGSGYTHVNATISGAAFTNNNATQNGGAIYVAERLGTSTSLITINENTAFRGNSSSGNGGAIYLGNNVAMTIAGVTFGNNTATADGGGIFIGGTAGAVNVGDVHFEFSNSTNAATRGGAIFTNRSLTLTNAEFSEFTANQGGAIYSAAGTLKISDTSFYKNTAVNGGAIYNGVTCTVVNSSFYGNQATGNGGAIFNNRSLTVVDSSFAANGAAAGGGALFQNLAAASMQVLNSVLVGNYSTSTAAADDINYTLGSLKMVYSVYGAINNTTGLDATNKASNIGDVYNARWDGIELKNNDTNAVILENNVVVISKFGMAAYSGTLIGERSGIYYYRDMATNLWRNLSNSTTYAFNESATNFGLTGGTIIDLGQNLGDRTVTHLAYNAGAYVLEIARELPSVIVTTDKDVINPFDYLISLREAIEVYGGRTFSGTYLKDGAAVTLTAETIGANITFAIENFTGTNLMLTVYSQLTVNATYLSTMTIDGYNDVSNAALQGNVTIKVENAGRILSGGSWIANPSASTYRIFTFSGNNANWDLEFTNLDLIGGLLDKTAGGGAIYVYGATAKLLLDNVNISGSQAGFGGAVAVEATGDGITLNINDSIFTGNMAADNINSGDSGGAVSAKTTRTNAPTTIDITITGASEFRNNSSSGWGGAIGAISTYDLNITITGDVARNIIFDGNQALYGSGGAILAQGTRGITNLVIDYVTMNNNTAEFGGGAIFMPGGTNLVWNTDRGATINVTNSIFSNNKVILENSAAVTGGGAFGILHERLTEFNISDSTFSGNSSTRQGGAILILDYGSSGAPRIDTAMTLTNTHFLNNTAGQWGGAIYMYGNITVNGGSFEGNSAGYCGAIMLGKYKTGNGVLTATGTLFEGNHATSFAGATSATSTILEDVTYKDNYVNADDPSWYAYAGAISGGSLTLKGTILFEGNSVTNTGAAYGGAFYGATLTVEDGAQVSFINNSAVSTGEGNALGGAVFSFRDLSLFEVLFQGNSAMYGGAIYSYCNVTLDSCIFDSNSATNEGGAIYFDYIDINSIPTLTVLNCTFAYNSAGNGGAILNASNATVYNSTFYGNSAGDCGGAIANGGTAAVYNSTFYKNHSAGSGGAFYSEEGTLILADVTLAANSSASGGAVCLGDGEAYILNTLMVGNYLGDNINVLNDITVEDGSLSMVYSIYSVVEGSFTGEANTKLSETDVDGSLKTIFGAKWNDAETDLVLLDGSQILRADGTIEILNTGLAAYKGTLIGKVGNDFYYRDMSGTDWISFTDGTTYRFDADDLTSFGLTNGIIIDLGQNLADRTETDLAYNVGAYAIVPIPELPSIVVTTDKDVVNPFDYVISLREAIEVYGGRTFSGTYQDSGAAVTLTAETIATDITFAIENFTGTNLMLTIYSQLTIDAAYLSTMTINGYNNVTNTVLQGNVTVKVENAGRILSGGDWIANPSASTYRIFTAGDSGTDWNLEFSKLNLIGGKTAAGGAIYVNGANVELLLDNVNVSGSQATRGGAVAVEASGDSLSLNVNDSIFIGNMATDSISSGDGGGALFARTTRTNAPTILSFTITGASEFWNNSSSGWGGAIAAISSYDLNLTIAGTDADNQVVFDANQALYGSGGAIFIQGARGLAKIDIDYTTMNANTAVFGGGGVYLNNGSLYSTYPGREARISVRNSTFSGNRVTLEGSAAVTGGGAFDIDHEWLSTFDIADSTFDGNVSPRSGGAIMIHDNNSSLVGTTMTLKNTHFLNNISTTWGGAIYMRGNITITGGSFVGNTGGIGGAIMLAANNSTEGNLTATGTLFEGNGATLRGGAINAINMTLEDVTFRDNYVDADGSQYAYGGAIDGRTTLKGTVLFEGNTITNAKDAYGGAIHGASLTIADGAAVSFIGNSVASSNGLALGGALFITNNLDLTGVLFEGNSAQYGGAIYSNRNITVDGCTFKENEATMSGGAIYLVPNGTTPALIIRNGSVFQGNTAGRGGAIYANAAAKFTISDSYFTDNEAGVHGGAIYATSAVTVEGSHFNGNSAGRYGGAIYGASGVTVTDSEFGDKNTAETGNTAGEYGGAILAYGTITVENSEFYRNSADLNGGAICAIGDVILDGSIFGDLNIAASGNTAGEYGGAVCAYGDLQATGVDFHHNSAIFDGGALLLVMNGTITDSNFVANTARDGGAIYNDGGGDFSVSGSSFTKNSARKGGAIYSNRGFTVTGSTFTENQVSGANNTLVAGGAIAVETAVSSDMLTITDSTFTGNHTDSSTWNNRMGGAVYFSQIGTTSGASGTVRIDGASVFDDNSSDYYGGAVYAVSTYNIHLDIAGTDADNVVFNGNNSKFGGAIYIHGEGGETRLEIDYATFTGNFATSNGSGGTGSGGAIVVGDPSAYYYPNANSTADISIANSLFEKNMAAYMGGAVFVTHYKLDMFTIDNSEFTGNEALGTGGAISISKHGGSGTPNGDLIVTDSEFYSNKSRDNGGAIFTNSNFSVTDSVFGDANDESRGNTANSGGAVVVDLFTATAEFERTGFYSNRATGGVGGAVMARCGGTFTDVTFVDNAIISSDLAYSTTTYGGAIYGYGRIYIDGDSLFQGNYVSLTGNYTAAGGAIAGYASVIIDGDVQFIDNYAVSTGGTSYGGAIYCTGAVYATPSLIINGTADFRGNHADNGGAAAVVMSGYSSIVNISGEANFTGNEARTGNGGAIYISGPGESGLQGNLNITGKAEFTANHVKNNGGAIYVTAVNASAVKIANTTFTGNTAGLAGGAVWTDSTVTLTVADSSFTGNTADTDGGAIFAANDLAVTHSEFRHNSAEGDGGAIYAIGGSAVMDNTLIADSIANGSGGGIYATARVSLLNLTAANNTAKGDGGGMWNTVAATVQNSIFWGNRAATMSQINTGIANAVTYSGIESWTLGGTGNVSLQTNNARTDSSKNENAKNEYYVCFFDEANGDYTLDTGSYLINRGNNSYVTMPETDLTPTGRIYRYGNGGIVDMGAYESEYKGNVVLDFEDTDIIYGKTETLSADQDGYGDGDITFNSTNTDYLEIIGDQATAWKANEEVDVTVDYSGDDNWNTHSATMKVNTLVRDITFKADDAHYNYDGTSHKFSWDGIAGGLGFAFDDALISYDSNLYRNAGEYIDALFNAVISSSTRGNVTDNYNISYEDGVMTIGKATLTVTRDGEDKVYDGTTDAQYTWSFDGLIDGDDVDYNKGNASFEDKNVGTDKDVYFTGDSLSGNDVNNYEIIYNDLGADITKATLTVTRDGEDKVYDGTTDAQYTWSFDGLIDGDDIDYNKGNAQFEDKNVGTDKDVFFTGDSLSGNDLGNYEVIYNDLGADITKATLTVTRDGEDKVYDGTTDAQYTWSFDGLIDGDDIDYNKGNAQFDNKNVGIDKDVFFTGDSLSGDDLGNYEIVYKDLGADITKATLVVNRDGDNKVYDGTTDAQYTWSFDGLIDGDDIDYNKGNAQFEDKNVGTDKDVFFTGDSLNGADLGNYEIVYNDFGADITKATLVVNRDGDNKVYDGTTDAQYTWSFDGLIDGDDVDYNKGSAQFEDKNAGTDKDVFFTGDSLSGDDVSNYEIVYNDLGADITKATLVINRDGENKVYDGTTNANYSWSFDGLIDGDDVDYSKGNALFEDKNVGEDKNIVFTGDSLNGNDVNNYEIVYNDLGADITKATLVVNRDGDNKVYDGTTDAQYTWSFDGLIDGDDVDYNKGSAQFEDKNAGTDKDVFFTGDSLSGTDLGNYDIVYNDLGADITKATLIVTRDGENKVYDGTTDAQYTWSFDGLVNGDDVDYTKGNAWFSDKNAGTDKDVYFTGDSLSGNDLGNYEVIYNDFGADITKATLTVTRDGEDKVYDGTADANYTWSFDGLIAGDDVDYNKGNAQFENKNAGTDKDVYFNGDSLSGSDLGNYEVVYNDLGADITKATLIVTRDGEDKVYDGTTDAQYTWSFDGLIDGDDIDYNKGAASFEDKNVGEDKAVYFNGDSLNGADLGNYEIVYNDLGADITKAMLTLIRDGENKVYDGTTDAQYTWSFDGLIDGDDIDYNKGNAQFEDKNVGTGKDVYFNGDSLSGNDINNYEVIYNDLGADITRATLVVNRDGDNKVYDGTTDALYTWSFDGLIDGDDVDYNKGAASFEDKNAGIDKDVFFTGDSLSGDDVNNYEIVYNDLGADITKAMLTVIRDGEDKVYDGTTDAQYTWSFDGLIDGDDVDYNKGAASFEDKNAGTDKDVYFDGDSLSGTDLGNYDIAYNDLGADITKATLVVNRDGENKVYDGTTNADYSWSFDGLIAGDDVDYNKGNALFDDKNVGEDKDITITGDLLSGTDLGNYDIVYNDLGADITKATLTVTRDGIDKVYDSKTDAQYNWSFSGLINGDDVNYSKGNALFEDKNAGTDKTVYFTGDSLSGIDLGNYDIVYNDLGADITKATLTVTRDGENKVYDGTADANYTWSFDGLIDGDNVDYNKGNAQFEDKNAGTDKDVYFNGDSLSGNDLGNYEVIYNDLGADIAKATLTVTRDGEDKVYDGTADANYTWSFDGLIDGDDVDYNKGTASFEDKNAGIDKDVFFTGDSLNGNDVNNYEIVYNDLGADITKATLTVTRDGKDKVYDGTTDAQYTWSFDGLIDGDNIDYNKGSAQFEDKNAGTDKNVYFTGDSLSGTDLGNYDIVYNDLGADITKATLIVTRDGENKVYDGTTDAQYTWSFDGLVSGDYVDYTKGNAWFSDKNAGTDKDVYFTGDSLSGNDLGNYEVIYNDLGADIAKATLTVTRDGEDKVYDGTTNADYAWSFDGLIDGDDVDYNKGTAQFADKNAGTNKNVYFTGDSLSGIDLGNYDTIYNDLGGDIAKATLIVTRDGGDKVYDGTTAADYTWSFDGLIDGDDVNYNKGDASFSDKHAGQNKGITITGDSLSGDDVSNYEVAYNNLGGDIAKATLIVTRDGGDKVYDGTTAADYTWSFDGLIDGDDVNYNKGDASFSDKHAGQNKGITITGDSLSGDEVSNYEVVYNDLSADITKADLTIIIDDQTKTAGDSEPTFSGQTFGLVEGDSVTDYDRSEKSETAGTYAIDQYQINDGNGGGNYNVTVIINGTLTIAAKTADITEPGMFNIYKDSSSKNYTDNGMDEASLINQISEFSANRDEDSILDPETDGDSHSVTFQTVANALVRLKLQKKLAQKEVLQEWDREPVKQIVLHAGEDGHLLTGPMKEIINSEYRVSDKAVIIQLPISVSRENLDTVLQSSPSIHHSPAILDIGDEERSAINFEGMDFASVEWTDKLENFKDSLDIVLEELMAV